MLTYADVWSKPLYYHTCAWRRSVRSAIAPACSCCSAYASIRQLTSAYASIRQHSSVYVSIRQHTSVYVSIRTTICEVFECAGMHLVQRLERQHLYLCTSKASKSIACMTAGGIVSGATFRLPLAGEAPASSARRSREGTVSRRWCRDMSSSACAPASSLRPHTLVA